MPRIVNGALRYSLDEYHKMIADEDNVSLMKPDKGVTGLLKPAKAVNKYRNVKAIYDGIKFDSIAEKDRYITLGLMQQAGLIRWFNRQPSFLLPGGIRYRPDFIVCGKDGRIWIEDVKSKPTMTRTFVNKARQWAELYPGIELRVVTK